MNNIRVKIVINTFYIITLLVMSLGVYLRIENPSCIFCRLIIVAGLSLGVLAIFLEHYLDNKRIRRFRKGGRI